MADFALAANDPEGGAAGFEDFAFFDFFKPGSGGVEFFFGESAISNFGVDLA